MDTSSVNSSASTGSVLDQSAIYAIKKQRDAVAQTVGSLIQATTEQLNRNNPPHLGQHIDTTA